MVEALRIVAVAVAVDFMGSRHHSSSKRTSSQRFNQHNQALVLRLRIHNSGCHNHNSSSKNNSEISSSCSSHKISSHNSTIQTKHRGQCNQCTNSLNNNLSCRRFGIQQLLPPWRRSRWRLRLPEALAEDNSVLEQLDFPMKPSWILLRRRDEHFYKVVQRAWCPVLNRPC